MKRALICMCVPLILVAIFGCDSKSDSGSSGLPYHINFTNTSLQTISVHISSSLSAQPTDFTLQPGQSKEVRYDEDIEGLGDGGIIFQATYASGAQQSGFVTSGKTATLSESGASW